MKRIENLIGRQFELQQMAKIAQVGEATILVVYGRRRVGKTVLLEYAFADRHLLKFEGLEGVDEPIQRQLVMKQLADYVNQPHLAELACTHWVDVFQAIAKVVAEGVWTVYFEEVQWLADYSTEFISALKYVWDNHFRHNKDLVLILCGSSPSFIIEHVLHSKALYNRSQHEIALQPFNLIETQSFLKKRSDKEVMDAFLCVGGIPEYLKWVDKSSSVFLGLCENAFVPGGFFANEYQRIFTSSLSDNPFYKRIIDYLSRQKFATRDQILKHLKIKTGGSISSLLMDLELCGFIRKYVPYNLGENSKLARYCITDAYLHFYYQFIKPIQQDVAEGRYSKNPAAAIKVDHYQRWLGYAFEKMCQRYHSVIANRLGFGGVHYRSGAFYNRSTNGVDPGYQMDLLFDRDDKVITICEIKYTQSPTSTAVIEAFERKLELFPNQKNKTIHRVLISQAGAAEGLRNRHYFDEVLTLKDFFQSQYW